MKTLNAKRGLHSGLNLVRFRSWANNTRAGRRVDECVMSFQAAIISRDTALLVSLSQHSRDVVQMVTRLHKFESVERALSAAKSVVRTNNDGSVRQLLQ